MSKTKLLTTLLAVIALAAGLLVQQAVRTARQDQQLLKPLDFSFPDVSEHVQAISQWRGKVLVINFWATWCAPCLKEIPEFMKIQAEYQALGLQFIGVAIEDKQAVADYLHAVNINYPVMIAGDAGIALSQQLGNIINAVPFTLIVDQAGQVVHRQPGELSREELLEIINPLISGK